jgi:hypothetical protein
MIFATALTKKIWGAMATRKLCLMAMMVLAVNATPSPSQTPTETPTAAPSHKPTSFPVPSPTFQPSFEPTRVPTPLPTPEPSECFACPECMSKFIIVFTLLFYNIIDMLDLVFFVVVDFYLMSFRQIK